MPRSTSRFDEHRLIRARAQGAACYVDGTTFFDIIHDMHADHQLALRRAVLNGLEVFTEGLDLHDGNDRAIFRQRVDLAFRRSNADHAADTLRLAGEVVPRRADQSKDASHHRALADAYLAERGFLPSQMASPAQRQQAAGDPHAALLQTLTAPPHPRALTEAIMPGDVGDETVAVAEQTVCFEWGEPVVEDASPGVWIHDADELGDRAYDLNENHVARPDEDA